MPDLDTLLREYFDEIAPAVDIERGVAERQLSPTRWPPAPIFRSRLAIALAAAVVVILVIGAVAIFSLFGEEPAPVTEPLQPTPVTTLASAPETTGSTPATTTTVPTPPVVGLGWARIPHDQAVFGPHGLGIADIVVGGPGLVAVGFDLGETMTGAVWTSTDGVSWSRVPHDDELFGPAETRIYAVTIGGPGLVAVGEECTEEDVAAFRCWVSAVWTSPDGVEWTRLPTDDTVFPPESFIADVVTFGDTLVIGGMMCGEDPGCRPSIWTSLDGVNWAQAWTEVQAGAINDLAVGSNGLVAVGYRVEGDSDDRAAIWSSSDGINWQQGPYEPDFFGFGAAEAAERGVTAVSPTSGGFVAVGQMDDAPAVWVLEEGSEWSLLTTDPDLFGGSVPTALLATEGGLLAVGRNVDGAAVWTSSDGSSWNRAASAGGEGISTVVAWGEGFVAGGVADEGAAVWISPPPPS